MRVGGHRDTQRTPRGSIAQWKLNVTDQGSDRSCICVLWVSIFPLSTILILLNLKLFRQCGIFFSIYYHSSFGYRVRRGTNLYFNVLVLISPSSYHETCRL